MQHSLDSDGRSPLHHAAADALEDEVQELIDGGADVNLADKYGWTALHFASQSGSAEIVSILLRAGADVNSRDSHGNTALWRAVFCSEGRGEIIQLLRAAGADPYAENDSGVSPIALAHSIGNYDVQQYFADLPAPG